MKASLLAAAAALTLFTTGAAVAQDGGREGRGSPAMAAVRKACAADAQKLCPNKAGPDRRQCMIDHFADMSDGCKTAMAAMRAQMQGQTPQ